MGGRQHGADPRQSRIAGGLVAWRLLAELRGARNPKGLPRLTLKQIRGWAKLYRRKYGCWPTHASGPIPESPTPGETWKAINSALEGAHRGLPGEMTLDRMFNPTLRGGEHK